MSVSRILLFKRKGIYYIAYSDDDGHRRWKSTGCSQKPETLQALTGFREFVQSKPRSVPLSHFAFDFSPILSRYTAPRRLPTSGIPSSSFHPL